MRTKKSTINLKKINSQIKKPHLKMIPIKDKNEHVYLIQFLITAENVSWDQYHSFG